MANLLIMEDEVLVCRALKDSLESAGHQVTLALDGSDGSRLAASGQFDLAIIDIFMPIQDGIATIMELKKSQPSLKVIAISGGGALVNEYDYLEYAEAMGAIQCFYKPIDTEELLSCIKANT
ncbi:MAG: hypothetical protein A2508_09210 [Candidatus Lambdaproteobacteria bacterium RIFOXYD12_FULL_49_8]|uniref:Response regulatory domain-containing protein n=1 Tax=Candidatus Lambdaproteobacteria bacterium RIFOXYD2_FULL_50_16 TaxID=1817772 RepID=A0A1F6GEY9_9PROT|nr:MAG: hypothetical protein A2527_03710 [Candidatus Lambdaproteobacteria bacterium RIFOXYD2_FULL_50_16]OGG97730.1 MAG: hypothetical protein A2508_09210 [Candidatus Lambdaproteobacteria bacterium RIFOXYD12_FULL_49_8]